MTNLRSPWLLTALVIYLLAVAWVQAEITDGTTEAATEAGPTASNAPEGTTEDSGAASLLLSNLLLVCLGLFWGHMN